MPVQIRLETYRMYHVTGVAGQSLRRIKLEVGKQSYLKSRSNTLIREQVQTFKNLFIFSFPFGVHCDMNVQNAATLGLPSRYSRIYKRAQGAAKYEYC